MKLQEPHRDRCYFHLGYGNAAGIPAGDLSRLEEALDTIKSNYMLQKVLEQLDRCDRAWELSELANDGGRFQTKSLYQGDINRSIINVSAKDNRVWWENYLEEGRRLAQLLWVPYYYDEESLRYRFERTGADFIATIPGCADTVAVSRVDSVGRYAGSFGF